MGSKGMIRRAALRWVLLAGLVACGDGGETVLGVVPTADLGSDGGGTDAGVADLGADAGAEEDAGPADGGPDLSSDLGPDLAMDFGPDLPMDLGPDLPPDLGPPPAPSVCADRVAAAPLPAAMAPDRTVGDGTLGSCTEAALRAAVALGGRVAFDCGEPETVLVLSEALTFDAASPDLVLDGGGTVTLDGASASRLVEMRGDDPALPDVALLGLTFRNGRAPSAGGELERSGGAVLHTGGRLVVADCTFEDNEASLAGTDAAGGALSNQGDLPTFVVRSTFRNNRASSGGAIGMLIAPVVILESTFEGNDATGIVGAGGNGGAIYGDGPNRAWTLCGLDVRNNDAGAFGGGLFRVAQRPGGTTVIERSRFESNLAVSDPASNGGGLYLEGMAVTIEASALRGNRSIGGGGLWVGGSNTSLDMTNVMLVENTTDGSLGAGLALFGTVPGTLRHVTFAANETEGAGSFAAAIFGGGDLRLEGCLFADQVVGNGFNAISCLPGQVDGGGNVQWPVVRSGGGSDDPDALCAPGVTVVDPDLGPLGVESGATGSFPVRRPRSTSAVTVTGSCPATDLLGNARGARCTVGAVE